jgi:hypothetical protein
MYTFKNSTHIYMTYKSQWKYKIILHYILHVHEFLAKT